MKYLMALTLLFVMNSSYGRIVEGPKVGNGGGAWGCELNQKIEWIEIMDLFEAREEYGLEFENFFQMKYKDIVRFAKIDLQEHVQSGFFKDLDFYIEKVYKSTGFIKSVLRNTEDSFYRLSPEPETCPGGNIKYIQVANFLDEENLYIRKYYWKRLNEINKAALVLHEAIYYVLREKLGDTNSIMTRRIVGLTLSNIDGPELSIEILNLL